MRRPALLLVCATLLTSSSLAGAEPADSNASSSPEIHRTGMIGPFDPEKFVEGLELQGAVFWVRRWGEPTLGRGWEVSAVSSSETIQSGLGLSGTAGPVFRYLGDGSWSGTLSRHRIVGGPSLGPLQLLGGFGFSTLTVDRIDDHWGVGLLSPMSTASLAAQLGRVRVEAGGYVEYLWRWNRADYWLRGISLALRVQR